MAEMKEIISKSDRLDVWKRDHSTEVLIKNSIWAPGPKMKVSERSRRVGTGTFIHEMVPTAFPNTGRLTFPSCPCLCLRTCDSVPR